MSISPSNNAIESGREPAEKLGITGAHPHELRARRIGIDTYQALVIYICEDSHVARSEGFESETRIHVRYGRTEIDATLNVITGSLIGRNDVGLSEAAWAALGAREGDLVTVSHSDPIDSASFVRSKIYGGTLAPTEIDAIIHDVVAGRFSDVLLSAFLTACAAGHLSVDEITSLTQAMISTGSHLTWGSPLIVDKHCVGGLPGNRTTPIVVPIVAAAGLLIPKTSSRAITSPAGTADTMEVFAPVDLSTPTLHRVVEREGGCIVWGGKLKLSPADDILIRIERALDLDSGGQLIASILSKKVAAGSNHVLIDIPVGPTAKIRSTDTASRIAGQLEAVGQALGLRVSSVISDGSQPIGNGIGPALEARDVLAVLSNDPDAPDDLRRHALELAGRILEFSPLVKPGAGFAMAEQILLEGGALKKFEAICNAQGGMRRIPLSKDRWVVTAPTGGIVTRIDSRRLSRIAKLAGAPLDKAAGLDLHAKLGTQIIAGEPLYTIHSETAGELQYALNYAMANPTIVTIAEAEELPIETEQLFTTNES